MELRTKAGILFACLGLALLGLGSYLLLGTSFFFLGNGLIASGKYQDLLLWIWLLILVFYFSAKHCVVLVKFSGLGTLIGLDKLKKARWVIWFLRKIPICRQILSLPIICHVCNYICPEEHEYKKEQWGINTRKAKILTYFIVYVFYDIQRYNPDVCNISYY